MGIYFRFRKYICENNVLNKVNISNTANVLP